MNKTIAGVAALFALTASTAFASAPTLVNGGFGQRTTDESTFGFAICNQGTEDLTAPTPVSVAANGVTVSAQSASPIAAGACGYTYLSYDQFNMIGGHTYSIQVDVAGNTQTYTATVPGAVLGASISNVPESQTQLALMSTEIQLIEKLISLVRTALGQ